MNNIQNDSAGFAASGGSATAHDEICIHHTDAEREKIKLSCHVCLANIRDKLVAENRFLSERVRGFQITIKTALGLTEEPLDAFAAEPILKALVKTTENLLEELKEARTKSPNEKLRD